MSEEMATVCRECGKRYRMLGKHVLKHGLSPHDYKLKYDLPLSVGLVCQETFDRMSESKHKMWVEDPGKMAALQLANPPGHRWPIDYKPRGRLARNLPVRAKGYRDQLKAAATAKWEARKPEFVAMWMDGKPLAEMAAHFGTGTASIRNWRVKWQLPPRRMVFVMEAGER